MLLAAITTTMALASFAAPSQSDAAIKAAWPRTLTLNYCWGTSDFGDLGPWCPCADLTLHKRPRDVDVFDCATGTFYPAAGTWSKTRRWRTVTFEFGVVTYSGSKQPDGTYRGMMITTSGLMGIWEGEFIP